MRVRRKQMVFWFSVIAVVLIFWLSKGLLFFERETRDDNLDLCLEYKKNSFHGRVIKTEISENRGTFIMTILEEGVRSERFTYCLEYPESRIQVGDSIYKPVGEFVYYIFKESSSSNIDTAYCDPSYCNRWK